MSQQRIRLLEPLLANQIAAGEVIERPASVVKELIENSLDAGASRIEIDIVEGGLQLIRIRDNGSGIHADDLPLAVSRHATSKVASLTDLEYLQSLGFRGEALASICSVSRFALTSCTPAEATGWQVKVAGREMQPTLTPAPHPPGTTVEVADLFFNTPARRKFLRSAQTEWLHILELIKRIALSRFDVGFYLNHQQKSILQLRIADNESARLRRLQDISGASFIKNSTFLEFTASSLKLWGWAGLPSQAPTQPSPQYFYVNGRMIRDRLLLHAVRQAYEALLPEGRHPVYVLYLEVEPSTVDVNVHPTKHEVRFRDARLIHDFIFSSLRKAIAQSLGEQTDEILSPVVYQVAEQMALYPISPRAIDDSVQQSTAVAPMTLGIALSQLHGRYLLIQQPLGLGIIDLALAYEAWFYASLQASLQSDKALKSQPLLMPATLTTTENIQQLVEMKQEIFKQCGMDIAVLTNQQLILRALPAELRNTDMTHLCAALEAVLEQQQSALTTEDMLQVLAKCYFAPNKLLKNDEINQLLQKLAEDKTLRQRCLTQLSLNDISKLFSDFRF